MKPVKLGIIGLHRGLHLGKMIRDHCRHLFELKCVCDLYKNNIDDALEELNLPGSVGFQDYRKMLRQDGLEAVLIEVGTQIQPQICCDALDKGKHVLCDVPLAFTRKQCRDLLAAVEKTGLVFCMGEQVRFANFVLKWQERIACGEIGDILFIQGEYIHPIPGLYFENKKTGIRGDAKGLIEYAGSQEFQRTWRNTFIHPIKYIPHELSPLLKIIDDRVVKVSCYSSDVRMYKDAVKMLDLECALFQTEKGRTIRIVNSFTAPRGISDYAYHWYHIMGSDGFLENVRCGWNNKNEGEIILKKDGSYEKTNYGWLRDDLPFGNKTEGHSGLEFFVFQDFFDAIKDNRKPEVDVYTAVEATLPGIIAAESTEAGGEQMAVPDVRRGEDI